ncbi:MAG: TonB-dependent receptor [Sphingomicrobium sp.]
MSPVLSCALYLAIVTGAADPEAERPQAASAPQDIIVTGERLRRSIRDTASSVVVIPADMIEALAAPDRLEDLLPFIANVQMGTGGQGPTIRGQDTTGVLQDLPAFLGGTRPRATLQVDGRASSYNEFVFGIAPLWDVEQVEVFRSPQTTTQGRNSIAGAIVVKTRDPDYYWLGRGRAIHGSFGTWQGSAMLTGPIVGDQLAFRVSADLRRSRPSSEIADTMRGADPNRDRYGLLRFKLRAEPEALPGLSILSTYVHSESQMPQVVTVREPFRNRRDPLAAYGIFGINSDSLTTDIRQSLGPGAELAAILSLGDSRAQRFAPPGLGETQNRHRDLSLEAWASCRSCGRLSGRIGTHLLRTSGDQRIDLTAQSRGIGEFDDRQHSFGLFGEGALVLGPLLTASAGLRFQRDCQDRSGALRIPSRTLPLDYDRCFTAWLPKLTASFQASEAITVGLLAQRAFNPGGVTLNVGSGEQDSFEAERLWNYEIFARGAVGSLSFGANLFYNDISDSQRPLTTLLPGPGGAPLIVTRFENAPRATSYGGEAQAQWQASDRLSVRLSAGALRTRVDEALLASDPIVGNAFARAPRFSGSALVDWQPVEGLRLSGSVRHHGAYFSNDANTAALRIGRATTLDARAGYEMGRVTAFAYGRNLLNSFNLTYLYNASLGTAADPREIGIGLQSSF